MVGWHHQLNGHGFRYTLGIGDGFAFAVRDAMFADSKGKKVNVDINGFDVLGGKLLEGTIIRSSDNSGEYIVGCRMPQDSKEIKEYVSQNYSE